mmetsp:Transcript_20228/g.50088  ORF Transcript_20228/g.50088 Transcript_20228/m.50088 type:complete len:250 (-) Transcript_20228:990-1739(-)
MFMRNGVDYEDTNARLDRVKRTYADEKLSKYINEELRPTIKYWSKAYRVWNLSMGLATSTMQEGVHWSLKSQLRGRSVMAHMLQNFLLRVLLNRKIGVERRRSSINPLRNLKNALTQKGAADGSLSKPSGPASRIPVKSGFSHSTICRMERNFMKFRGPRWWNTWNAYARTCSLRTARRGFGFATYSRKPSLARIAEFSWFNLRKKMPTTLAGLIGFLCFRVGRCLAPAGRLLSGVALTVTLLILFARG